MYLTSIIRSTLYTAADTQCWKQNQSVKTTTRPVWDRVTAVSNPKTDLRGNVAKTRTARSWKFLLIYD